jgi:DNA-binding CsgD family transcriptional regulator
VWSSETTVKGDVLSIIEAAYAESASADAWLQGMLVAIGPHLDHGAGVFARSYRHWPGGFWHGPTHALGAGPDEVAAVDGLSQWLERLPRAEAIRRMRRAYPLAPMIAFASQLVGRRILAELAASYPRPVSDSLGVIAGDPSGHGCVFFTMGKTSRVPPRTRALWQRIAAHVVGGYRLAREHERKTEAVLDPVGKVLHREGGMTGLEANALSDAARGIDRARGRMRRVDPDRALDLWKGLVAGRWSLVDQFDHDGKRYVFAKRNALDVLPWHSLTERELRVLAYAAEGQTLKITAYQLGVSVSTIAEDLARVKRKLGLTSRVELVTRYRARRAEERTER